MKPSLRLMVLAALSTVHLAAALTLVPLTPQQQWQRAEWRIEGAPTTGNNFDPDLIQIDADITSPSGRVLRIPAFWYQDFQRAMVDGAQVLRPTGAPEWRLRFTPDEAGQYSVALTVKEPAQTPSPPTTAAFSIPPTTSPALHGWIRTAADQRFFNTSDGGPLRLIGANVCWGSTERATYDYDR